ncbi:DNA replication regulator Sld3 [Penicillium odoratum]|uniref:DNA replication regulator Sld3 n=1 Tax=Penicillium odoratum TaxID=1167516 RepID=UPI002548338C|nr:DNA replication regulator Sld3 [Penicillium odoratum]KAJ5777323.1 DNA replication regulator Sld3 [Penicillium odoratum]
MTARVVPTILDPLNASALNKLTEPAQPLFKKRKIGHEAAAGQLASSSIVIRAHAASLSDEPLVFDRITTLPRSRLPLSWLEDASWSHSDAQPGGLFVADIPVLENDLCACAEPTVLAVRLVADGGLYVIERVKRGIYSLNRLARWVHEGDVVVAVKGWQRSSRVVDMEVDVEEKPLPVPDALNWWQAAQIEEPLSDLGLGDDFAALHVDLVYEDIEADAGPIAPSFVDVPEFRGNSVAPASKGVNGDMEASFTESESQRMHLTDAMDVDFTDNNDIDGKQSHEELLNGMRDHYLQALYISKTSLAYFAKGPLTRCRAAFQSSTLEPTRKPSQLVDFYREAILAAKKMDLKYREALPAAVQEAVLAVSDGERGTKKRKSKKKKMSKNGLYPEEEDFIHKWWKDRIIAESSAQENSREAETRKHISDLRLRETQLQILLILEVMALEWTPVEKKDVETIKEIDGDKDTLKKPRPKKSQDLNVLLELHLDRLCIWHAVGLEEPSTADTARTSAFNEGHMSGKKVESDAVRDFCTEVIVPFYAARLPGKCKLITRKFGVSGGISPAGKKLSNKRERPGPGAEVKRQAPPQNTRRSLQRVLTDEKAAAASQNRHPSLHRSSTAPSKQETSRDSMEPLLPTVLSGNVRGGIQVKRVENREVDLNAVARQHESKLRKVQMLVDQKKELDAAIHALRKPNREMVANDIIEDATKRASSGGGSSRKPKNPVRNPYGQGVQVMATPRGNRKKDAVVGMPPLPRSLKPSKSFAGEMENHSLAESPVMIPSSTRRAISFSGPDSNPFKSRRAADTVQSGRRQQQPTELGSIQETPTRPPNRLLFDTKPRSTDPGRVSSSASKVTDLFRVPQLPESRTNPSEPIAPSTPVSSRRKHIVATSTPESSRPLNRAFEGARSLIITETPPKQRGLETMPDPSSIPAVPNLPAMIANNLCVPSSPVVISTPVKGAGVIPVTPDKPQSKSIYDQLGWDDDDMDLL